MIHSQETTTKEFGVVCLCCQDDLFPMSETLKKKKRPSGHTGLVLKLTLGALDFGYRLTGRLDQVRYCSVILRVRYDATISFHSNHYNSVSTAYMPKTQTSPLNFFKHNVA